MTDLKTDPRSTGDRQGGDDLPSSGTGPDSVGYAKGIGLDVVSGWNGIRWILITQASSPRTLGEQCGPGRRYDVPVYASSTDRRRVS